MAAFHAATPFYGGHIIVSRQVGVLLPIITYGAQQQVGEKTAARSDARYRYCVARLTPRYFAMSLPVWPSAWIENQCACRCWS